MAIVDGKIRCFSCGELKPTAEFQPAVIARGCGACRSCKNRQKTERYRRNPEKYAAQRKTRRHADLERHNAMRRAHYRKNPDKYREYFLKGRYGIGVAEFDRLLALQSGGCACCGGQLNRSGKRLFVDHDHATGKVRGILCYQCNTGLGNFRDSLDLLERAVAYLKNGNQPQLLLLKERD